MQPVGDHVIPTIVLHEALWCNFIELSGLPEVVTLYVLCMEVVLHYISVPIAILALVVHLLYVADHFRVMDLVGDGVIVIRVSPSVGWRYLIMLPQVHFDLACIICVPRGLFILGIIVLLCDRIKAILGLVLVNSLKLVQFSLPFDPSVVVERVSVRHNVEVSDSAGMYLSLPARLLYTSGAVIIPIPVMSIEGEVRDYVVILL